MEGPLVCGGGGACSHSVAARGPRGSDNQAVLSAAAIAAGTVQAPVQPCWLPMRAYPGGQSLLVPPEGLLGPPGASGHRAP